MSSMASNVVRVISAVVENSKNEINGKILTRPALLVTDGDSRTYCVDVDIGIDSEAETLKNVPLARASRDLLYADVGNACRLRRTASGQWEVVGYSKELPGTYKRFAVNLTDFSFGPVEDRSISGRLLTYEELGLYGTYGSIPYGATVVFKGNVATNLGGAPRQGTTPLPTPVPVPSGDYGTPEKPFAATSPWNTPIPADATYASDSDERVQTLRALSLNVEYDEWTMPVYYAQATDPLRPVFVSALNLPSNQGNPYYTNNNNANAREGTVFVRMPAEAVPDTGTDAHLIVIDETRKFAYEMWYVHPDGSGGFTSVSFIKVPLDGDGVNFDGPTTQDLTGSYFNPAVFGLGWGSVTAYGGSALGGLIRAGEATQNKLTHALRLLLPFEAMGFPVSGRAIWPATHLEYHCAETGPIIMGTRVAIKRSVNLNTLGLSAPVLAVGRALQEYGAYLCDSAGTMNLNADSIGAQAEGIALLADQEGLDTLASLLTVVNPPNGVDTTTLPVPPGC